ncbi:SHOCT domain-containing protein [Myceligenerans xiligouense]|nr:hypothetical protein [Myceligenerans xiligouense]
MGFGSGMGAGWILVLVLWIALIVLITWAVTTLLHASGNEGEKRGSADAAAEVLDRRLAAGEISSEEYQRVRDQLAASRGESRQPSTPGRSTALVVVIVVALLALLGTVAWATFTPGGPGGMMNGSWSIGDTRMMNDADTRGGGPGTDGGPMRGGGPMTGDDFGVAGTGPVTTLAEARTAAERYADPLDLRVAEVMQFDNGFYAELSTPGGDGATEVLIDADDGDVRIEYGPAMMWNTEYGVHTPEGTRPAEISPERAQSLADEWLAAHDGDVSAGHPEAFPGYYTLHTEEAGTVTGMLSVNASTGAVWYHAWHGEFVDMG